MEPELNTMTREERVRHNLEMAKEGHARALKLLQRAQAAVDDSQRLLDIAYDHAFAVLVKEA